MDQRDKIHEAAFRLFTGVGYSGVTMDRIARACGMGKATLYKYFPSKEALLFSCVDYFSAKIGAEVERIVTDPTLSSREKVTGFVIPVVQFVSRVSSDALGDIQRNVPEAYRKIEENRKKIILSNIVRIICEGKASGIFRGDVDGVLAAHILIGAISHLSSPQVLEELALPTGQLFNSVLSILWEGCLSEQGRAAESF